MSISLQKGQKISLSKESDTLDKIIVGLGWDQASVKKSGFFSMFSDSSNIDCDASALLLKNGKLNDKKDVIYFGNLTHKSGSVNHTGDNLTGEGDGDDEQIVVQLKKVPNDYDKVVVVVNIYQAKERKQHFGMIQNAFIRIVDANTNVELCKYNLTDNYEGLTAMVFGELYRHNGEWKFNAIGQGTSDLSITELAARYK